VLQHWLRSSSSFAGQRPDAHASVQYQTTAYGARCNIKQLRTRL
jgi:hypothetical protein